jgi:uncharacterized membrane protein YagU involved in acid resistance
MNHLCQIALVDYDNINRTTHVFFYTSFKMVMKTSISKLIKNQITRDTWWMHLGISRVLVVVCCTIATCFQDLNIGGFALIGFFVFFGCHPHGTTFVHYHYQVYIPQKKTTCPIRSNLTKLSTCIL